MIVSFKNFVLASAMLAGVAGCDTTATRTAPPEIRQATQCPNAPGGRCLEPTQAVACAIDPARVGCPEYLYRGRPRFVAADIEGPLVDNHLVMAALTADNQHYHVLREEPIDIVSYHVAPDARSVAIIRSDGSDYWMEVFSLYSEGLPAGGLLSGANDSAKGQMHDEPSCAGDVARLEGELMTTYSPAAGERPLAETGWGYSDGNDPVYFEKWTAEYRPVYSTDVTYGLFDPEPDHTDPLPPSDHTYVGETYEPFLHQVTQRVYFTVSDYAGPGSDSFITCIAEADVAALPDRGPPPASPALAIGPGGEVMLGGRAIYEVGLRTSDAPEKTFTEVSGAYPNAE